MKTIFSFSSIISFFKSNKTKPSKNVNEYKTFITSFYSALAKGGETEYFVTDMKPNRGKKSLLVMFWPEFCMIFFIAVLLRKLAIAEVRPIFRRR